MGYLDERKGPSSYVSPVTDESQDTPRYSGYAASMPALAEKDSKYKKYIRVFRFITRLLSVILNALVISTLSLSLYKYYTTKARTWQPNSSTDPGHLWPLSPILWPTFVLLGVSVMTFIINLFTLLAYCCGVGTANKVSSVSTWITTIFLGIHFAAWIAATGSYRIWSSADTLWGWSCSSAADELTATVAEVKSFVDFGKLCDMQTGTWYISIMETVVYLLTFITMVLTFRRMSQKKKLEKMKGSMNTEAGYDLGIGYKQKQKYMPLAEESPSFR